MSNIYGNNQELNIEQKIKRSKIQMFKKSPFFSVLLLKMKMKEQERHEILEALGWQNTMGVDNQGNIYWDREWISKLTEEELTGVLAHEVMHVCLMHIERVGTKDPRLFNVANDIVVNYVLKENDFVLPKEGYHPDIHAKTMTIPWLNNYVINDVNKKSSERIYEELYPLLPPPEKCPDCNGSGQQGGGESQEGEGQGNCNGQHQKNGKPCSCGGHGQRNIPQGFDQHRYGDKSGKKETKSQKAKRIRDMKSNIAQAVTTAREQGKFPDSLARMIDDILEPKINWKEKLYKYVVAQIQYDFSYDQCSKRTISLGVFTPRPVCESVHIVVSIDTSGSIQNSELKEFFAEIKGIADNFANINMDIIVCDAQVHETFSIKNTEIDDLIGLKLSGGGGTSHRPIYEHVNEHIHDCKVLLNFTDGFSDINYLEELGQGYDNLFIICKQGCDEEDIKWGEVIKLHD